MINTQKETLFNQFPPSENTLFSSINGTSLLELIILLKNYYLTLRENLNLNKKVSFGLELEFTSLNEEKIRLIMNKLFPKEEWLLKKENSVKDGLEIASAVLIDEKPTWYTLKDVCEKISKYAKVNLDAGAHIHVGAHILGSNKTNWLNLMKLWAVYENIVFRFSYNEYLTARPLILGYAPPIANSLWYDYEHALKNNYDIEDLLALITRKYTKEHALTFSHVYSTNFTKRKYKNTLEFRLPNGTLDPIIWQNNVNVFTKMMLYAKSSSFNHDIIDKRYLKVKDMFQNLHYYNEIFLDQALEFCDLIFTSNIDKLNFLKQYLKNYKIIKNRHDYENLCILTRK